MHLSTKPENSPSKSLRWSSEDPRDETAIWGDYSLRVKAEQRGTIWVAYVKGPNLDYKSEHVSKDAAKQRSAKVVREAAAKAGSSG